MGQRDGIIAQDAAAHAKLFGGAQDTITSGAFKVVDVRGMKGFVAYGTGTYQPCDASGTVVSGSTQAAVVSGKLVNAEWTHYKVVAGGANFIYCVV